MSSDNAFYPPLSAADQGRIKRFAEALHEAIEEMGDLDDTPTDIAICREWLNLTEFLKPLIRTGHGVFRGPEIEEGDA